MTEEQRQHVQRLVARTLRSYRKGAGLTQGDVADRTGMHRPIVSRIESGRYLVSLDTLVRYAHAVGVAPHDVLAPVSAYLSDSEREAAE